MIKMLKQKEPQRTYLKQYLPKKQKICYSHLIFSARRKTLQYAVWRFYFFFFLNSPIILHNFAHVVLFISCFFRNFRWQFLKWIWQRFSIKHRGFKHNSISLHFCKLCQHVFILKLTTNEVTSNRMGNLEWFHFSISIFYNSARNVFLMLFFLWISHVTYLNCIVLAFNSNID